MMQLTVMRGQLMQRMAHKVTTEVQLTSPSFMALALRFYRLQAVLNLRLVAGAPAGSPQGAVTPPVVCIFLNAQIGPGPGFSRIGC